MTENNSQRDLRRQLDTNERDNPRTPEHPPHGIRQGLTGPEDSEHSGHGPVLEGISKLAAQITKEWDHTRQSSSLVSDRNEQTKLALTKQAKDLKHEIKTTIESLRQRGESDSDELNYLKEKYANTLLQMEPEERTKFLQGFQEQDQKTRYRRNVTVKKVLQEQETHDENLRRAVEMIPLHQSRARTEEITGRNIEKDDLEDVTVIDRKKVRDNIKNIRRNSQERLQEIVHADRTIEDMVNDGVVAFNEFIVAVDTGEKARAMNHLNFMRREAAVLQEHTRIKSYQTAVDSIRIQKITASDRTEGITGRNIEKDDLEDITVIDRTKVKNNINNIRSNSQERLQEIVHADRTIEDMVNDGVVAFNEFIVAVDTGEKARAMDHLNFMRREAAVLQKHTGIKSYQTAVDSIRIQKITASDRTEGITGINIKEDDLEDITVIDRAKVKDNIRNIRRNSQERLQETVHADRTIEDMVNDGVVAFNEFIATVDTGEKARAMDHLNFMREEAAVLQEHMGIKPYQTAVDSIRIQKITASDRTEGITGINIKEDDLEDVAVIDRKKVKSNINNIRSNNPERLQKIVHTDKTISSMVNDGIVAFNEFIAAVDTGEKARAMDHLNFMRREAAVLQKHTGIKSYQTAVDNIRIQKKNS